MDLPVRRQTWSPDRTDVESLATREWLVTNGLGGYSSGTVAGICSRRYHGMLVAALPGPWGRMVMLTHLATRVRLADGTRVCLGGEELARGRLEIHGARHLREFRLEGGLPIWTFELAPGVVIEKRVVMPYRQNTVHVGYRLLSGDGPVRLKLRPSLHFRGHEEHVGVPLQDDYELAARDLRFEIRSGELPPLRLTIFGDAPAFTISPRRSEELLYRIEESRGYEARGELWSPGELRVDLDVGRDATLVASTESWEALLALTPEACLDAELARRRDLLARAPIAARSGLAAELVLAADQFIVEPAGRVADAARARAEGDEVRSVIAGYHWFTDWGRDTMISLEGLTLATGRHAEAGFILRTFGHYVRDGLLPNLFPEGESEGLYHTADATLWFFHAVHRYVEATGDRTTLERLRPVLRDIVAHHLKGTRFGIGVDHHDGLLRQGAPGYQLTWMDAKVGDWVVTPRRGKAVEINALWFNALKLLEGWEREAGETGSADALERHAARAKESFNRRFWNAAQACLYDVIDTEAGGNDAAIRPNQIFAVSLDHAVLDEPRWAAVLETVRTRLLTPVGLRSLAKGHPDYKERYFGDLRARDAAYHQGTVWGWLIGPFVDAWLKVHPGDEAGARRLLEGFDAHLSEAAIGSISEVFDAEEPFHPRGCVSQAWSVAEVLRCWLRTE